MSKQIHPIPFATIICVVCSLALAAISSSLKEEQEFNKEVDIKFNVLKALQFDVADENGKRKVPGEQILADFEASVSGLVLDPDGKVIEGKDPSTLTPDQLLADKQGNKEFYPLYVYKYEEDGKENSRYAVHTCGMGLWSVVKAYLAINGDLSTFAGVAFYENGETPGLGAEVAKPWFQDQWTDKVFYQDGELVPFEVVKGKVADVYPGGTGRALSSVDGISAATITCNGVTAFVNSDLSVYNKYFETLR